MFNGGDMGYKKDMNKGIVQVLAERRNTKVVIDPKAEHLPLVGNEPAGDIIPESGLQRKSRRKAPMPA